MKKVMEWTTMLVYLLQAAYVYVVSLPSNGAYNLLQGFNLGGKTLAGGTIFGLLIFFIFEYILTRIYIQKSGNNNAMIVKINQLPKFSSELTILVLSLIKNLVITLLVINLEKWGLLLIVIGSIISAITMFKK